MKHTSRTAATALLAVIVAALLIGNIFPSRVTAHAGVKDVSPEGTQERARELWEKAVAAKGGRERLRKIGSLYLVRIQPGGDRDYQFHVFPDCSFNYTYGGYREDIAIEVYNRKQAITWWLPPNTRVAIPRQRRGNDPSSNIIAQFTYLMVTSWMEPKPLRTRKEWVGLKRVDVVAVDANGWPVDYYLDPQTRLPIQVVSPYSAVSNEAGEMEQVVGLEDYALVDGVMMPRKASYSYTYTNARRKWTEQVSFEINPPYDPQFFEQPPTARTTPESWRAKDRTVPGP